MRRKALMGAGLGVILLAGAIWLLAPDGSKDRVEVETGSNTASPHATFPGFPAIGNLPDDFIRVSANHYRMPEGWETADVFLARQVADPARYQPTAGAQELLVTLLRADIFDPGEIQRALANRAGAERPSGSYALPLSSHRIRSGKDAAVSGDGGEWVAVQWHERPGLAVSVSGRNLGEDGVLDVAEHVTFIEP